MGFTAGIISSMGMGTPHYYIDSGICTDCETCQQGLDVAFAMDYTGSMSTIIESVKVDISDIAATIDSLVDPANKYRLSLQLTDEQQFYTTTGNYFSSYLTSGVYTGLPSNQKYAQEGTTPSTYSAGVELHQVLTTMEPFADNNLTSFQTQLAKTNNNTSPNMGLGAGIGSAEPYDMSIDKMIDGGVGIGPWRKAVSRIGITFADNAPGGDDDSFANADELFMLNDLSSKLRINNIRWMRFGPLSTSYKWDYLAIRSDGATNDNYSNAVVSAAIIAACERGEIPYRMTNSNGNLKTKEFTPWSWNIGIHNSIAHWFEVVDHDDFTINPSTGMTFSLWIKPSELTSQKIFCKTGEYEIGTDSNDKLFFSVTTNNGVLKITTKISPLVTTNWQHVLCTWDGSFANANGLKIYWAAGSATGAGASHTIYSTGNTNVNDNSTGSTGTSVTNTSNNIYCGGDDIHTAEYDGLLSDVAIYKEDLTPSQATLILNSGRPQNIHNLWNDIDKDSLVGYWRPLARQTVATSSSSPYGYVQYGWESKNGIFYGYASGSSGWLQQWSVDVPSSLGQ